MEVKVMEKYKEIERSIIKTYRKEIWSKFVKAVSDYELIKENDNIMVCISGGKDSFLLAKCIEELQKHGRFPFKAHYVVMDPGYNELNRKMIEDNAKILNVPIEIFESNIFDTVKDIEKSPCYLCARMRRGFLYSEAQKRGCNKIALGHHFDDVIETVLMSMFYGAEYKTMMPKVISKNYHQMELIRPLYLVKEQSIVDWCKYNELEFLQCACDFTKNNLYQDSSKRKEIKLLISDLRKKYKDIDKNIFHSFHNVNLNTIIGYHTDSIQYHFLDDYDLKKQNH